MDSAKQRRRNEELAAPFWHWWPWLAVPYALLTLILLQHHYLGDTAAYLLDKTYLAAETGHLESIGFVYPPLPFLLLLPWPSLTWLAVITVAAAGWLAALLLRELLLTNLPRWMIVIIASSVFSSPGSLLLGTENLPAILGFVLLFLAFMNYDQYVRDKLIYHAFQSGLWLSAAFFTTPEALYFLPAFALLLPFLGDQRDWRALFAAMGVLAFPTLAAIGIWAYLSWLFTGHATFAYPAFHQYTATETDWLWSFPIYWGTAFILAARAPVRLLVHLVPLVLMVLFPFLGLVSGSEVAVLFTIFAIAGLPRHIPSWGRWVLLIAALGQWAVAMPQANQTLKERGWWKVGITGQADNRFAIDLAVSRQLAKAPPRSILTDDRQTYKLVAMTGTSKPFLLPANSLFAIAANQPAIFCPYLLLGNTDNSELARFDRKAPAGMVMEARFNQYTLYRRRDAPPLLYHYPMR
ncbi:hypothetical protein [Acidithiobacillus sulfuriphilus]|uniref:hypothetical protein n=1 Tax=Acidithiobacillus sulfuriphilus TaxID=1867749 RepID=UPI003F5F1DC6